MLIDGKHIAKNLEEDLKKKLESFPTKKVAFVMFGNDRASAQFIKIKSRVGDRLGIETEIFHTPDTMTTEIAINDLKEISNKGFDGIVIQLPLPIEMNTQEILNSVPAAVDIDVLGDIAKLSYQAAHTNMVPPVAAAVGEILKYVKVNLEDKNIVLVGNGKLVGEPVGMMLKRENIPFSVVDVMTEVEERDRLLSSADIIISGAGVPSLIKPDMIKPGVILIDAGTSEQVGKLAGDIDPECEHKASYMTPVPGGVGPVTVVNLFKNLIN